MNSDLLDLFNEEASGYIQSINQMLLQLEMADDDTTRLDMVREMHRMAHSMKGAARAVGFAIIETVSLYLEEIFGAMLHKHVELTPDIGDAIYDGLDLIERKIQSAAVDEAVVATVLSSLEAIVTRTRLPEPSASSPERQTDSIETIAISNQITEMPAVSTQETVSADLLNIFRVEVEEYLAALNDGLLQVEVSPPEERDALLREMNRIAHSMKGAARAVGLGFIEQIGHLLEDVFQQVLNGQITLSPHVADVIYDGLDLIADAMTGQTIAAEVAQAVMIQLNQIVTKSPSAEPPPLRDGDPVPAAEVTPEIEMPPALMTTSIDSGAPPTMLIRSPEESVRVAVDKLDQLMADVSELLVNRLQAETRQRQIEHLRAQHIRWQREWRSARAAYIRLARKMQDEAADLVSPELATLFRFLESNEDYLSRANRELTQLSQWLSQDTTHLGAMADQLQNDVASLRMMPFEIIIGSFQRVARDMARDVGKQLHLEISGVSVEIDKTVLDALKDPLMHLLRNAIDHGIETPEVRVSHGKSPSGHLQFLVEQRGSEIEITVRDDGQGLNVELIRQQAVDRGLITVEEAEAFSPEMLHQLIFQSGLTTSKRVTAISGRGLGMDIVRSRVENLRGRVSVTSVRHQGTTITINVPVSLTRLRVVTLRLGDEHYAIPSVMVERMETVPLTAIYTAEGKEMLNLNNQPVPLASLASFTGTPQVDARGEDVRVVALRAANRLIAFEVDALHTEIELVLKPLGREMANAPFVAGAALLGSGEVIIVLDANDLVRQASGGGSRQPRHNPVVRGQGRESRPVRVLIVDDSITTRTLEKNILESVGFDVYVAIDGAEAWQRIPEIEPDLIVSDVEMPRMNGLELTRLLRAAPQTSQLPIILLTSLSKPEQREAGLEAGADAYLIKSRFDQRDLLDTIQSVL